MGQSKEKKVGSHCKFVCQSYIFYEVGNLNAV